MRKSEEQVLQLVCSGVSRELNLEQNEAGENGRLGGEVGKTDYEWLWRPLRDFVVILGEMETIQGFEQKINMIWLIFQEDCLHVENRM